MKGDRPLNRGISEVWQAWDSGRYDLALVKLQRLMESNPANASLLIMRAQLTQLQEDPENSPSLDDALADLKLASALDPQSPVALVELGYLLDAQFDDAKAASKSYQKAIRICRDLLREALIGQAKALSELGRDPEALTCLVEALSLGPHHDRSGSEDALEQLRTLQRAQ